jgi:putative transposase
MHTPLAAIIPNRPMVSFAVSFDLTRREQEIPLFYKVGWIAINTALSWLLGLAVLQYIYKSVVSNVKGIKIMQLDTNNHSVFILHYHLIMCIKYRNKVIDDNISNRLKEIFEKIAPAYNITLEEWNHDTDHVHILFKGQPNTEISKFINAYKSASSRLIKKEFPQIRKSLWKEMFWSQSFCLLTTGGATVDIIKQYIMSQGKKNGKQSN